MRYQLTIGSRGGESRPPHDRTRLQRLKSVIVAFLTLSTTIGVLIAAVVLGSILASVILAVVLLVGAVWFLSSIWRCRR